MSNIKSEETKRLIPISMFDVCLIDGVTKKHITKLYPTRKDGAYYLNKFKNYLKDKYKLTIIEYCEKYLKTKWPKCPISNEKVGFSVNGKGVNLSKFKVGCISRKHCPKFDEACEKFSKERKGKNNPMYGATPWNKGKDKRDPRIRKIANDRKGTKTSEETRQKQSESAKKRKIHGHTGKKHSEKTKRKLREITSKRYQDGVFNKKSSIQIKVCDFLKTLNLKENFKEEYQIKYFSADFAFPENKIAIEVNGTFFHIDPRVYPNGPICAIQRRNFGRDKAKEKYLKKLGWKIIKVWEIEVNDGRFQKELKCKLQKLNLLKN